MRYITLTFAVCCLSGSNTFANDLIQTPTSRFNEVGVLSVGYRNVDSLEDFYSQYQWGDNTQIDIHRYQNNDINSSIGQYDYSMDLKFLLKKEDKYYPQIALGIDSVNGNYAFESEYITFSRKYYDFDFHTGVGWGMLGEGSQIKNPLSFLGEHFERPNSDRIFGDRFENLFTGKYASLFGGASYQATDNLKFNIEYNSTDYANLYHKKRGESPISLGFDYDVNNITISAGAENLNKFMTKINYKYDTKKLTYPYKEKLSRIIEEKKSNTSIPSLRIVNKAHAKNIQAYGASIYKDSADIWIETTAQDDPIKNMLEGSRLLYQNTGEDIKWLDVVQTKNNIDSIKSSILRQDLENLDTFDGSMDKLIKKAKFSSAYQQGPENQYDNFFTNDFFIRPVIDIDISQRRKSLVHRTSIISGLKKSAGDDGKWNYGVAARLNLTDNIKETFTRSNGRSDEKEYADELIYLENLYARRTFRPAQDLYFDVQYGFLEEKFYGTSLEAIYKPIFKNWAIGAEFNELFVREPYANLSYYGGKNNTSGLSFYYEPDTLKNTVLKLSYQEYVGGDDGVSISASKTLNNGIKVEAFVNLSDEAEEEYIDTESFRTNAGLRLLLPLQWGSKNNYVETNFAPIGLHTSEKLNKPENLYDDLRQISYNNFVKFKPEQSGLYH